MTSLQQRRDDIEKYGGPEHPHSYYTRLLEITGGVEGAAGLDAAWDGDDFGPDMRRRPFAGNEELKRLYRERRDAQARLREAIARIIWDR